MLKVNRKGQWKRFLYSKLTLVLLCFLLCILALGVWDVYKKERETSVTRTERLAELEHLAEREQELKREIERLGSPRGAEAEVRSKFEVGREGEKVIVIVEPKVNVRQDAAASETGFLERLKRFFTGGRE